MHDRTVEGNVVYQNGGYNVGKVDVQQLLDSAQLHFTGPPGNVNKREIVKKVGPEPLPASETLQSSM